MTAVNIPDDPLYFHPPKVLIADSDSPFRTTLCRYLGCFGFCCQPTDSAAILANCETAPPDLLIVDLHLPPTPAGLSGWQICRREHPALMDFPILALTRLSDYADPQTLHTCRADDQIIKATCDPSEIVYRVRALLYQHRPHVIVKHLAADDLHLLQRSLLRLHGHIEHEVQRCKAPSIHLTKAKRIIAHMSNLARTHLHALPVALLRALPVPHSRIPLPSYRHLPAPCPLASTAALPALLPAIAAFRGLIEQHSLTSRHAVSIARSGRR